MRSARPFLVRLRSLRQKRIRPGSRSMSEKSLSLYHIEEELKAYLDSEALVPEEQLAEFQAEFLAKSAAAVRKRGDCIRAISHIEAQIAGARAEENRIAAWRGSLESGLARF